MSDIHREFELTIWQESLYFGIAKGNSITTAHTLQQPSREQTERKGDMFADETNGAEKRKKISKIVNKLNANNKSHSKKV